MQFLASAKATSDLTVELWGTGLPENAVPVERLLTTTVRVPAGGPHWVTARLGHRPAAPENVIVVVRAATGVALRLTDERVPGVLALRRKADGDAAVEHDISEEEGQRVLEWQARGLRRRTFCFRAVPDSAALAPEKAVGGFQRPYGGPQTWSSTALDDPGRAEQWLRLDWETPQNLRTVHLVFDDDVDEYLNNLHRHRTPYEVMPELVRHYRLQTLETRGVWRTVVTERDNRRRHRVHHLDEDGLRGVRSLRGRVDATHGARHSLVVAVRVY
ncbi:hypothetical protein ACFFKE_34455 [Streptomyces mutabilis]|uniref:hypothetical protein n=1 Tax=Streptomyces mutabilis TaxID=67332 RepID=UPI00178546BE|nr:hypothetical protein [Streptomyces mutabilis]GGQ41500.1 hypothetical protein GCM10010279_59070 [Streptomyces mutabilis]